MRNSTKYICFFIFCTLFLSACNVFTKHDGYTYNKKLGYYYKLLGFSDTYVTAHPSDVLSVRLSFFKLDTDSVVEEMKYEVVARDKENLDLALLLLGLHTGDSVAFIVPKDLLEDQSFLPAEIKNDTVQEVQFSVCVSSIVDSVTYAEQQREKNLWKQAKHDYETFLIQQYMKRMKEKYTLLRSGIYKRIIKQGRGDYPEEGEYVSISFQGGLLDGKVISQFSSFDFCLGSELQVIKGIELALKTMKKGERAKILIPSEYAWGEYGSSDGSVPAYTPVVFDLELK
ncbi:MAG: FKBP-type peptidyl-prolyl cis-trans isomerase [Bacteroidales bacterium]|nr:FKBP-type peptidyl-prolyl cis-trans isomerase [Bacteroidales bacterium]